MMNVQQRADDDDLQLIRLLVAKRMCEDGMPAKTAKAYDISPAAANRYRPTAGELHVDVDLGREVVARLVQPWYPGRRRTTDELVRSASEIVEGVADLLRHASDIRRTAMEVMAAARREIAKANRRGLSYEFISGTVVPFDIRNEKQPLIRINHTALGISLTPEPFFFETDRAEGVVAAFSGIRAEQESRAVERERLGVG